MAKYPFIFKVVIYLDDGYHIDSGLGFADSYADAARILDEQAYKEDLVSIQHLELLEYSDVICAPWGMIQELANANATCSSLTPCDCNGNIIIKE